MVDYFKYLIKRLSVFFLFVLVFTSSSFSLGDNSSDSFFFNALSSAGEFIKNLINPQNENVLYFIFFLITIFVIYSIGDYFFGSLLGIDKSLIKKVFGPFVLISVMGLFRIFGSKIVNFYLGISSFILLFVIMFLLFKPISNLATSENLSFSRKGFYISLIFLIVFYNFSRIYGKEGTSDIYDFLFNISLISFIVFLFPFAYSMLNQGEKGSGRSRDPSLKSFKKIINLVKEGFKSIGDNLIVLRNLLGHSGSSVEDEKNLIRVLNLILDEITKLKVHIREMEIMEITDLKYLADRFSFFGKSYPYGNLYSDFQKLRGEDSRLMENLNTLEENLKRLREFFSRVVNGENSENKFSFNESILTGIFNSYRNIASLLEFDIKDHYEVESRNFKFVNGVSVFDDIFNEAKKIGNNTIREIYLSFIKEVSMLYFENIQRVEEDFLSKFKKYNEVLINSFLIKYNKKNVGSIKREVLINLFSRIFYYDPNSKKFSSSSGSYEIFENILNLDTSDNIFEDDIRNKFNDFSNENDNILRTYFLREVFP